MVQIRRAVHLLNGANEVCNFACVWLVLACVQTIKLPLDMSPRNKLKLLTE